MTTLIVIVLGVIIIWMSRSTILAHRDKSNPDWRVHKAAPKPYNGKVKCKYCGTIVTLKHHSQSCDGCRKPQGWNNVWGDGSQGWEHRFE